MHDYAGTDTWHAVGKVLDDNNRPSAANLAISSSGPDRDCLTYLKNRGVKAAPSVVTSTPSADVKLSGMGWAAFPATLGLLPSVTVAAVAIGDLILIDAIAPIGSVHGDGAPPSVRLRAIQDYGGSNLVTVLTSTETVVENHGITRFVDRITMAAAFTVTVAGALRIELWGYNADALPLRHVAIHVGKRLTLRATRVRPFTL